MKRPRIPMFQPALGAVIETARTEADACAARGDTAGRDMWLVAVDALLRAQEIASDAHCTMDWERIPEPPIEVGALLGADEEGIVHAKGGSVYYERLPTVGWARGVPNDRGVVWVDSDYQGRSTVAYFTAFAPKEQTDV